MSTLSLSLLVICFLLIFLFFGVQIWAALAFIGIVGFVTLLPFMQDIVGTVAYNSVASLNLAAIPLFLFMGEVLSHSGVTVSLYRGLKKLTNWLPGGVVHSNILSCAIFAAVSGSSVATVSTFGTLAYHEQKKLGYPRTLIAGSIAAGGTLGILIPPSITMLIYCAMTGNSAAKLFMAGIIPGVTLALFFMLYICFWSIKHKSSFRITTDKDSKLQFRDLPGILWDIFPFAIIITSIIYGIYSGLMTPTEAAGLSVVEAFLIAFFKRKLTYSMLRESAIAAFKNNAMIILIQVGALIFGNFISMAKIPATICLYLESLELSKYIVLAIITVIYLILGMVMEAMSAIVITLPITYPLMVTTLGFGPLWFGIYLVIMNQAGLITPPVGLNTFIIHAISKEKDMSTTFRAVIPYVFLMILLVCIMVVFPNFHLLLVR